MGKKCNKPKSNGSKRVLLKTKFSIKKKIKEHNKKMNREARKVSNLGLPHRKHDRDLRLPNSYPFKAQVIEAAEKRHMEEHAAKLALRAEKKEKLVDKQVAKDLEAYETSYAQLMDAKAKLSNKELKNQVKNQTKQQ